ncbi:hypothetical protein PMZ80_002512 [Knufia obscura]|uniref:Capsule polysaccharide biosynthesis protein n=2 Tax=Knufia TaxID=430999 RepID=A0AAN8I3W5_9EURO|nr:hypothetical protein PMZ80_002512 [Knufia obscura]KAK5950779.1 hypothetical protein OHC33_008162 [Knufia fluminis]
MAQPKFSIPPEYQSQLRHISPKDTRTDAEILTALSQHQPVTSEKNIWAYWHSGLTTMPPWCQRNILGWVRINGPSWTVRVLDSVPDSPNHFLQYIDGSILPEAFVKGEMTGPYTGPHSADFLKGACPLSHGGVFLDVGCIMFNSIDKICWRHLEDDNDPWNVAVPLMYAQTMANHFVAARKGDPFVKRWHELFMELWRGQRSHEGLIENPLIGFGKTLDFEDSRASKFRWDFAVEPVTVMEYIAQVLCWVRLCMLEPVEGASGEEAFDCSAYWEGHVMVFDVLKESWGAEETVGFGLGERIVELLGVRVDGDVESREWKDAYKLVWRLLSGSSLQKVTHGKGLTKAAALGVLLDRKENEGVDCAEGTFGELLRYGCVHFEQTREEIELMEAKPVKMKMKKGVFEP